MNTGIIGASGYIGEQLVKLLFRHPIARPTVVTSRTLADTPVESSIPSLRGKTAGLKFTPSNPDELAARDDIELYFLALPHGAAALFARPLVDAGKKVIDLSADFRLGSAQLYEEFYGQPHPDVDLLSKSAYVIPEIADSSWTNSPLIACPGCYPTSILVPLVPLLRTGVISPSSLTVASFSGVSGAGKKAEVFYSFAERAESATAYGLPRHRHLSEIEEQLTHAAGETVVVQFAPHLAPMKNGIISTIFAGSEGNAIEDLYAAWQTQYGESRFVSILPSGTFPDTAHVSATNRVDISAVLDQRTGNFVITSAIDNLMKGAGGQAVQIMNLWHGFDEHAGLE